MIIITISEIEKALGGMKFGKAAEVCGIPFKLLKAGVNTILRELAAVKKKLEYLRDPCRLEKGCYHPKLQG